MSAPSAGNAQPWHFVIIRERTILDAVGSFHPYARMINKAPVAILVCADHPVRAAPVGYPAEVKRPSQRYDEARIHHDRW